MAKKNKNNEVESSAKTRKIDVPIEAPKLEKPIEKPEEITLPPVEAEPATVAPTETDSEALARIKGPNAAKLGFSIENGAVKNPQDLQNAAYAIRDIQQHMPANKATTSAKPNNTLAMGSYNAKVAEPAKQDAPKKFAEMLFAGRREQAEKEKTAAAKMQQYYALTDALKAIGKMGGAAVGGAISGDTLGGAPNVGEYKESRGYLDAFERAKQANDRLRALDEQQFQVAFNKHQQDEERKYQKEREDANRAYKQQEAELERQWQIKFYDYKTQIEQAIADKDWARSAELKLQMAQAEQEHNMALQRLRNAGSLAEKQAGHDISKWQAETYNTTPIGFADGTSIAIPDNYYQGMVNYFMNSDWNGRKVNKDNVTEYIKQHPAEAMEFLARFGLVEKPAGESTTAENTQASTSSTPSANQHYYENQYTNQTMPAPAGESKGSSKEQNNNAKKTTTTPSNSKADNEQLNDIYNEFV